MPSFDLMAAKQAGVTDSEIAELMGEKFGYNTVEARKAGFTDQEIIGELSSRVNVEAFAADAPPSQPKVVEGPSRISFKQKPVSTLGIATPRQQEEAQALREVVTGKDVPRPRRTALPELRTAPEKNIFEKGFDAVRGALSPYDDSEAMDPGKIAEAAISMDAQSRTVPAKTVKVGDVDVNLPARPMERNEYVDLLNPEGKKLRVAERFAAGAAQGVKGVATGALGALQAMGVEPAADAANALQGAALSSPQDASLEGELGAGFGSLLTFLIPAMGVQKVASLAAKMSPAVAKYAAAGTMTALEAATEGGGVYREMLAKGETEEAASAAAAKTFFANLPLNFVTDKAAFFPEGGAKGFVKQAANSAMPEGMQEGSQEYISQRTQPGKVQGDQIVKSAAIGALTGGVTGGAKGMIDRDLLDPGRAEGTATPQAEPAAEAQPKVDPFTAHMNENPPPRQEAPQPEERSEEPAAEAKPEPAPQDVPINTLFKQPDGSVVKLTAVRAKEGGYILKTTIKDVGGNLQTTSTHDPIPGSLVLETIEKYRPAPVVQPVEEAQPAAELTRQEFVEQQPVEVQVAPEIASEFDAAAHESAASPTNDIPQPTQAQKEAGTYKKGHFSINGLNVAIENPQGSKRSGTDPSGSQWETEMQDHYGYIKGTKGVDKDHIDIFVKPGTGPETVGEKVFVVDQINPATGELDEHKTMLGYDSKEEAQAAYLRNYDKSGPSRIGAITETTATDFKEWLKNGDTKSGFAPQAKQEAAGEVNSELPKMVRTKTFKEDGSYHVKMSDGTVYSIFRDTSEGGWYLDGSEHYTERGLAAWNKADALKSLVRMHDEGHPYIKNADTFSDINGERIGGKKGAAPTAKPEVNAQPKGGATKIQQLRDSIAEGELILKTGKFNGKPYPPSKLAAVERSVRSTRAKLEQELTGGTMKQPVPEEVKAKPTPRPAASDMTAEQIVAEGMQPDRSTKGEIIVVRDGKNIAKRDHNSGTWEVYEGGMAPKNLVSEDLTLAYAVKELKGLRGEVAPAKEKAAEAKSEPRRSPNLDDFLGMAAEQQEKEDAAASAQAAEQSEFAQILVELEAQNFVEKRKKGKSFSSTSDFQERLKEAYPSVYSIGAKKEEVVATVQIAAGKGGKKVLTHQRQEILDAFRGDIARLKELYGELDAVAEKITTTTDPDAALRDFLGDELYEEMQNEGRSGEAETVASGAETEGSSVPQEEGGRTEGEATRYERTEAGDQGRLVKGAQELGKGKNPKAKGIAGLEDMELFTEPKEREAENRQGGFGFDTGGYSERTSPTRETTQTFLELPELVRLYKLISDGKLPKLVERMGNALGRMTHSSSGEANIKLRKDLFAGPQIAAESFKPADARGKWGEWQESVQKANPDADIIFRQKYNRKTGKIDFKAYKRDPNYVVKILAHEIGHFIDYLPDYLVRGRGNILGHIAALKRYTKDTLEMYPDAPGAALTAEDKARLKAEADEYAKSAVEDIVETVTRTVPVYEETGVTAQMITEIWNGMEDARTNYPELYRFIASMKDSEKKAVVVQAMKGLVDERLQALGRRQVGTETVTETIWKKGKPTAAAVKARLDELIQKEVLKRRLYERSTITDELKKLTQIWKPFTPGKDAYTKYRHSASELYADAVSVLFNEPQLLKDTAPTFYKAFFYYMGERPAFRDAYRALSRLSLDPYALAQDRYSEEMDMYQRGAEKAEELRKDKPAHEKIYDTLMRSLVDRNHDVLKELPKTKAGEKVRNLLEEIPYLGGEVENYVRKIELVKKDIESAGLTINDLSALMLAKHIIENRSDIANTQGKTAATEKAKLEYMKYEFGAEKMEVLEQAAAKFKEARKHILGRMEASGIVTDSLMEKIREREDYAHIDVQAYMDEKFGDGTSASAGWKKLAEGTLADINNVYVATVLQDMAILRMAKINESKRALTDVFAAKGLATLAEMKWDKNFGGKRPVEPGNGKALLTVMVKGSPVYYVVDQHVADTYQYSPIKAMAIGKVAGYIQTFFRDILVSKNPAWMLRNVYRDMKGTVKNNPEIAWWNPMDRLRLIRSYKSAFKEVYADVMKGERSEDIEMMRNEHMLNAERMYSGREQNFDNELERIAAEFQFGEQESASRAKQALLTVYNYLDKWGKVSEQTSKVGGMKYLRAEGLADDELAHRVRTRVGTPDFKRQGSVQQLTNNIFMFSNVNKEGTRSAYAAFKDDPISYSFKTVESNILPKLLLGLAVAGAFGDELKEITERIPSWDRRSYSVIPLPTPLIKLAAEQGWTSKNATAYFRLPQDYEGQFFGALAYDITQGDAKGVVKDFKGAQPYKLHPMLDLAWDWAQYLSGSQPYDGFRQKDVLTQEQQVYAESKGLLNKKSLAGMGVHTYGMLGLGNIYKVENKEFPKDHTGFEQFLKTTPFNALGSYLQVNDAGRQEQLVKMIREKRNEKAIQSYEVGDVINDAVREGKTSNADIVATFKALRDDGKVDRKTNFGRFRARYLRAIEQKEYGIKPVSKEESKALADAQ